MLSVPAVMGIPVCLSSLWVSEAVALFAPDSEFDEERIVAAPRGVSTVLFTVAPPPQRNQEGRKKEKFTVNLRQFTSAKQYLRQTRPRPFNFRRQSAMLIF